MRYLPLPDRSAVVLFAAYLVMMAAHPALAADLTAEMNKLDGLDGIHAAAVGQGGEPGAFHTLAKRFLAKGTAADFERLTADKVPLTRAMGAYCLARAKAPRAVPVLKAMVADPWPVDIQSGCIGGRTTVGQFAGHLLRNRNYLEFEPLEPLAPAAEGFAADVVRLADDTPIPDGKDDAGRAGVADVCRYLLDKRFVALDRGGFEAVLGLAKGEPRWRVVKGIGRVGENPVVRELMIGLLRDPNEDPTVRLAAASALTRQGDPAAAAALRAEAAFLDAAVPGLAGRLAEAAALRATMASYTKSNDPERSNPSARQAPPPAALAAADHPMVLEYVTLSGGRSPGVGEGAAVSESQLIRLVARLPEFGRRWDTYSDAAVALELDLGLEAESRFGKKVADATRRDVRRAIRARE